MKHDPWLERHLEHLQNALGGNIPRLMGALGILAMGIADDIVILAFGLTAGRLMEHRLSRLRAEGGSS